MAAPAGWKQLPLSALMAGVAKPLEYVAPHGYVLGETVMLAVTEALQYVALNGNQNGGVAKDRPAYWYTCGMSAALDENANPSEALAPLMKPGPVCRARPAMPAGSAAAPARSMLAATCVAPGGTATGPALVKGPPPAGNE
jgi:hypothetical protein